MKHNFFVVFIVILILISLITCNSNLNRAEIDRRARQVQEEIRKKEEKAKRKTQEAIKQTFIEIPEDEVTKQAKEKRKKQLLNEILRINP
ncbi:hypothetical protein [Borrelia hermsii]|uniref:Uncharacterized protein n=2 Tax=Borrelia hermsii TaxID=140 RepID=T1ECG9_BORHE|nr:hypothetical protein [Borrelia hermsii]ADN26424.1 hypothetical protein BHA025 [Borrelia hermsii]AMR75861.1 hypothetical protein A0V01_04425 [Borrelia hermsii]ANA43666.1 hypothetical protein AXX13_A0110 [Borrelia hermsii HS1]UCP01893.1 hypothetical protein K9R62_04470 [Borrelia hermsii]UPA08460.1 hypothetical protein bhDAH_001168 [Borrelia hermsii DAH]